MGISRRQKRSDRFCAPAGAERRAALGGLFMRILTAEEMRRAEQAAVDAGTSFEQLMENAGAAAAKEILALEKGLPQRSIFLLCGKGNNAGDAFVVGRLLAAAGWQVDYLPLFPGGYSSLAALNLSRLPTGVRQQSAESADYSAAVLVDGVFGTGFRGQLPEAARRVFRRANAANGMRVALDLPSGLNCDTGEASEDTFRADLTLTFGAYKPGLLVEPGKGLCGQQRCLEIGL